MTYSITVSNEKGGVAKTTTTMSLGASLSEKGLSILLVDLDPQGNLTLACGIEPKEAEKTSADVLLEDFPLKSVIRNTNIEKMDIVPCNSKMEAAEQILPIRLNYAYALRDAIQKPNSTTITSFSIARPHLEPSP